MNSTALRPAGQCTICLMSFVLASLDGPVARK